MAMSESNEYVIDGDTMNKLLEPYNLEAIQPTIQLHHLLPGQIFDLIEKKFLKTLTDEIDKTKAQTVKFVNLEAIATGPHKDYLYPICGGLTELIKSLAVKNVQVTGVIQNPYVLPWNIVAKIDKTFKGLPAPGQTVPP
ncbi:MAG TPA: hypothetical protein VJZ32_02495 [Candidatus Bathyarchaeia archaeon]|nr:hypothetical protein [Candidatus Bathyarchaeia archaeon]